MKEVKNTMAELPKACRHSRTKALQQGWAGWQRTEEVKNAK
jgi:hypothetical protein